MASPAMLAYTYQIRKIIRNMKHTLLTSEQDEANRTAAIDALEELCVRIEKDFS